MLKRPRRQWKRRTTGVDDRRRCDRREFLQEAVDQAVKEFGRLDVLVNNAAFQKHERVDRGSFGRANSKSISDEYFRLFLYGKGRVETPSERRRDHEYRFDHRSRRHQRAARLFSDKGAIHAFTRLFGAELIKRGIRVNCVAPGPVWTPLNVADKEPKEVAKHGADTPMKRPAQPEEISPAYVFFASDVDSSYITGEVMTLLGGETSAG